MQPDGPTIHLDRVARSFGSVAALTELSLMVPAGTVTALLGPNGAGKTTAVRLITGALKPSRGNVRVFGLEPRTGGEEIRRRSGVVAAKPALYDRLTGRENLLYAAELYGLDAADGRITEAASRFGIADALHLRVGGYSTGMKTRLALARAVLHDPDLLLLDEPTAGLDPESARAVLALIDEMAQGGKTVLLCTHLLLEAEGLADEVVILDRGRTIVAGTPAQLAEKYWPAAIVVLDAENRDALEVVGALEGVLGYERNGHAVVQLDSMSRVPDLVARLTRKGVRLTRVEPRIPTLEDLYFAARKAES